MTVRTLVNLPATARRGDLIEIRVTLAHPMETGYRRGADGQRLQRDIVQRFSCRYDGQLVFAAELFPAISANPYLAFHTVAVASGTLVFSWEGDNGFSHSETATLTVT